MAETLQGCQKLKYIAVDMPPVKLGRLMDLRKDFRLGSDHFATAYVPTEFEAMLVSLFLATPTLRLQLNHYGTYSRATNLCTRSEC
jgi:hypothetical protein